MPRRVKDQALPRVLKKLSAIRKTLSDEERAALDLLVVGPTPEVEGHWRPKRFSPDTQPEVEGHARRRGKEETQPAAEGRRIRRAKRRLKEPPPEVEGHARRRLKIVVADGNFMLKRK